MRERLAAVGAELRVDSERGRGTRLCISLPVPKEALISRVLPSTVMAGVGLPGAN
jgi:glucose-6-phosphate-specific signal transduction histidine kinase